MNIQELNNKIIIKTGLFGLFVGVVTLFGWSQITLPLISVIMIIFTIFYLKENLKDKILVHCVIIGFTWGLDWSIVQLLFFDTFYSNNIEFLNLLINSETINIKFLLILTGLASTFCLYVPIYTLNKFRKNI
tara:strand:- start:635 stop:1030 length:396 start_codon:yes stop_codon:yes gene_type:complete